MSARQLRLWIGILSFLCLIFGALILLREVGPGALLAIIILMWGNNMSLWLSETKEGE